MLQFKNILYRVSIKKEMENGKQKNPHKLFFYGIQLMCFNNLTSIKEHKGETSKHQI